MMLRIRRGDYPLSQDSSLDADVILIAMIIIITYRTAVVVCSIGRTRCRPSSSHMEENRLAVKDGKFLPKHPTKPAETLSNLNPANSAYFPCE